MSVKVPKFQDGFYWRRSRGENWTIIRLHNESWGELVAYHIGNVFTWKVVSISRTTDDRMISWRDIGDRIQPPN